MSCCPKSGRGPRSTRAARGSARWASVKNTQPRPGEYTYPAKRRDASQQPGPIPLFLGSSRWAGVMCAGATPRAPPSRECSSHFRTALSCLLSRLQGAGLSQVALIPTGHTRVCWTQRSFRTRPVSGNRLEAHGVGTGAARSLCAAEARETNPPEGQRLCPSRTNPRLAPKSRQETERSQRAASREPPRRRCGSKAPRLLRRSRGNVVVVFSQE